MPILTPEERLGTTVAGKYRLDSILGKGGMGVVFAAVHEWTGRPVAVKLLIAELVDDEEVAGRFLQEARAAARLDHPNVVDVLDMGKDEDGNPYMVLERLSGETLGEILSRERRLDAQSALEMLLPVMDALGEAHDLGIVHRDIKPSNIFIAETRDGKRPKLLDFGIAKMRGEGAAWRTTTGGLLGTPFYMSPEQVRETTNVGPGSDVWAIGVVLYRCLSGKLPFKAESSAAILAQILTTRPPNLDFVAPDVPPPIAHVVDVALRDDPLDRHADMASFAEELRSAAQASGTKAMARVEGHGLRPTATLPLGAKQKDVLSYAPTTPADGSPSPVEDDGSPPTPSLVVARAETARLAAPVANEPHTETLDPPALEEARAASGPQPEPQASSASTPFTTSTPRRVELPTSKTPLYAGLAVGGLALVTALSIGLYFGFARDAGDDGDGDDAMVAAAPPSSALPAVDDGAEPPNQTEETHEASPEADPPQTPPELTEPADLSATLGTLTVTTDCELTIDGESVAEANELALPPGPHELVCRRRGEERRVEVQVVSGEHLSQSFRFSRGRRGRMSMSQMTAMGPMLDIGRDYR